jgi:uncharacterized protein
MYLERDIKNQFKRVASAYNLVALVGPRQAGKTTFLKVQASQEAAIYLMFDDPDVLGLFNDDVKRFENQYLKGRQLTALDEVQYGTEAGKKLKYLADSGHKLWFTSSSQSILGKDVLSWLVGRVSIMRLFPFSFSEFLRARHQKELSPIISRRLVWEHLQYGGYPKVVLSEDVELKKTILKDLYETMVLKDIAKVFSIDDIRTLETFSRYLSHSIGNVLVYEKASGTLGLSFQTVKKYLDAMETSYLIARVQPFFSNKLREITKQPKLYFVDTGLRNAIAGDFPVTAENNGKLFENYVFCELLKMDFPVKYWQAKGGAEVDFVLDMRDGPLPIEVKISSSVGKIERSLRSFISVYKPKLAVIVFYEGSPGECKVEGCRVVFTDVRGLPAVLPPQNPRELKGAFKTLKHLATLRKEIDKGSD